ncbi:MAG: hypothetical protein SCALA702_36400 [Melioribacteraceae bacterium]|nr:MAG: hypothetical protein SCALA702_36400 [Melioribacteraceae bacterium]
MKYIVTIFLSVLLLLSCEFEPTENITPVSGFAGLLYANNNYIKLIKDDSSSEILYTGSQYTTIYGVASHKDGSVVFGESKRFMDQKLGAWVLRLNSSGLVDTLYKIPKNKSEILKVVEISPSSNFVYVMSMGTEGESCLIDVNTGVLKRILGGDYILFGGKVDMCFGDNEQIVFRRDRNSINYSKYDFENLTYTPLNSPNLRDYVSEERLIEQGHTQDLIDAYSYVGISDFYRDICYINPDASGFVYYQNYDHTINYYDINRREETNIVTYRFGNNSYPYIHNIKPVWNRTNFNNYSAFTLDGGYSVPDEYELQNTPKLNEAVTYSTVEINGFNAVTIRIKDRWETLIGVIKGSFTAEKMHAGESYLKIRALQSYLSTEVHPVLFDADRNGYNEETILSLWQTRLDSFNEQITKYGKLNHIESFDKLANEALLVAQNAMIIEEFCMEFLQDRDIHKLNKKIFDLIPEIDKAPIATSGHRLIEEKDQFHLALASYISTVKREYHVLAVQTYKESEKMMRRYFELYPFEYY